MSKKEYKSPSLAVDIIILYHDSAVFIKRKNPPYGWALPGGFVDYGESVEDAGIREAKEETSLDVKILGQLKTFSKPDRDPRQHVISVVLVAEAKDRNQKMIAKDDATEIKLMGIYERSEKLVFDHEEIMKEFLRESVNKDIITTFAKNYYAELLHETKFLTNENSLH